MIVVLVVCLGLVSLALLFGRAMLMGYRGSDDDLAGLQAQAACEGAARYAAYLMTNVTNDGDFPLVTTYQSQAVAVGDAFFWFIGVPLPTDPPGTPVFGLVDEASKLNINRMSATALENLPGMTEDLAEAIVNWRSSGGSVAAATSGAGAGISASTVKEANFESIEELAQVDGGTDLSTLYGNDTNLNHVLDPWEDIPGAQPTPATGQANSGSSQANAGSGQLTSGLMEYLTAFSREPKRRRDGTERVDVTGVSQRPARGANGATTTTVTGSTRLTNLLTRILSASRATTLLSNTYGTIPRPVRSVLEFYVRSGMTAAELGQVSPYLTIGNNQYTTGLVNVNTASQTVLACLPGMTTQLAGQLVAARLQQSAPSSDLSWVAPILGNTVSVEAGPYLTTRSYQATADVAATGRNGHGYRRTQFVLDASNLVTASSTSSSSSSASSSTTAAATYTTAQIVYRRNLAGLGWALGANARQTALPNGGAQ